MSEATDIEIQAANKAHKDLGEVAVGSKHLLSKNSSSEILDTYEKAELSNKDYLTGLYNRRGFDEELINTSKRIQRSNEELVVAFIDADNFKNINSKYGRLEGGDKVLKSIADSMRKTFRGSDILARWGGDEFAVIMTFSNKNEGPEDEELNNRLNENLHNLIPQGINPNDVSVTLGLKMWDKNESIEDFLSGIEKITDMRK